MKRVTILEAKTAFSKSTQFLETRTEDFIIVAKCGNQLSNYPLCYEAPVSKRIGACKG